MALSALVFLALLGLQAAVTPEGLRRSKGAELAATPE
jgi:hypothetical protein